MCSVFCIVSRHGMRLHKKISCLGIPHNPRPTENAKTGQSNRVSNSVDRNRMFPTSSHNIVSHFIQMNRPTWIERVLHNKEMFDVVLWQK